MNTTRNRDLVTLELKLGNYDLAIARCSDGDVIDFVDGEKQGIILIDTPGHHLEKGQAMSEYLRQEIGRGWGKMGSAEEELVNLGVKLASLRGELSRKESSEWFSNNSGIYVQFNGDEIGITSTGGITNPLIRRRNGRYQRFSISCHGKLDDRYLSHRAPQHNTYLSLDDLLLISSDGLLGNLAKSFEKNRRVRSLFNNYSIELAELALQEVLDKYYRLSAKEICNGLVSVLGRYFLPKSREYDDVTFAVIKKL